MSSAPPAHVLVLGDQLNRSIPPLRDAEPGRTRVVLIESEGLARELPHHKQKLVLVFSAMRHFAREMEEAGFAVDYYRGESFADGLARHLTAHPGAVIEVARPADFGYEERLREAAAEEGGTLRVVENALWLTSEEEFDEWAEGRKSLRLEYFYRTVRTRRGWLVDSAGEPVGGKWNFDAENRETPEPGHDFPDPPRFPPDDLTRSVMDEVQSRFPDHFGDLEGFAWPVTRARALEALEDFCVHRLVRFGPFEDAMVSGEPVLYHSLLSVPMNLGLLTAREVCERVLEAWSDPDSEIPIQSVEGFLRQVLGWREFIRHMYRRSMPEIREANGLEHRAPLPPVYWGGETGMRCMAETVSQLRATGHTHHIQRLMVLGNLALVSGVDPRELNDWSLGCYVDALDWVVTPNVMGMSQYADLGGFTSKPYAASGKYVDRMSDYCGGCRYDPRETVGENACPLNSLYWDFIDRHSDRFEGHPRMALMVRNWQRRGEADRETIRARAAEVSEGLREGRM
jgi:deoxyribodipyrimidine photolyase-related protein